MRMTLKSRDTARFGAGGIWKRWLGRLIAVAATAYLGALGLVSLASGRIGGEAILLQSLAVAVLPLLIVVLFALPGRRSGASVIVVLAVPFLHLTGC